MQYAHAVAVVVAAVVVVHDRVAAVDEQPALFDDADAFVGAPFVVVAAASVTSLAVATWQCDWTPRFAAATDVFGDDAYVDDAP